MPAGATDVIVFDRTLPRQATCGSDALATALETAPTFDIAIAILEAAMATPETRDAAVRLFSPAASSPRRFLNSLRALRAQDHDRALVAKATRLLVATLLGGPVPTGRRRVRLTDTQRQTLASTRQAWLTAVQAAWRDAEPRSAIVEPLRATAAARGQSWPVANLREMRSRAMRPKARPKDLAEILTAWECQVPIRWVRLAVRRPAADTLHA